MNYLYEIEKLSYITSEIEIWDQIDLISKSITPKDLYRSIDIFISNLNHNLTGKDYYTLCGIGDWARTHNDFTTKQLQFSLLTMAANWNEISLIY